ncbi:hypothetical protein G9A89_022362 [Geosiphon pyriformis]|nr:hypothetical protein G9A89_022362 [Geosiphon pyriformis]
MKAGAVAFFEDIDLGLNVEVSGLVSSTMAELQAIALALECVSPSCLVDLFSNNQTALDACKSESLLTCPDFKNCLHANVDWSKSSLVWHLNFHLAAGFTSVWTAGLWTYFMKALHHCLLVAVCKHLYNRSYSSIICLFCGNVEVLNHVFSCPFDAAGCVQLVKIHASAWEACSDLSRSFSCVLQLLSTCFSDVGIGTALCKGFVFKEWYCESAAVFRDSKIAAQNIVAFMHEFCLVFCDNVWLVRAKHQVVMEKSGMILHNGSVLVSVSGLSLVLLAGVVRLLGIVDAFGVYFGFCKSCLFFFGLGNMVSVHIST